MKTMKTSPQKTAHESAPVRPDDESMVDALAQHHRGLETAWDAIVVEVDGGDPFALSRQWRALERELLRHLSLEERELLPPFEQSSHGDEARLLRREHDAIREDLQRLGVELDRHQLRAEAVADFAARLRAHGRREDRELHPWIARHLPQDRWLMLERTPISSRERSRLRS
jgi:hypothetical protein